MAGQSKRARDAIAGDQDNVDMLTEELEKRGLLSYVSFVRDAATHTSTAQVSVYAMAIMLDLIDSRRI